MSILWDFIRVMLVPGAAGAVVAFGVLKYLSSKFVEQTLSKDLEKHKTELTQRTESLKTQLSIYAHEQNVATSRVDTQRAEAIKKVFAAIRAWVDPTTRIVAGSPHVNATKETEFKFYYDLAEEAHLAGMDLTKVIADHAIYFNEDTYSELYGMALSFIEATAHFLRPLRKGIAEEKPIVESLEDLEGERLKLSKLWETKLRPLNSKMTTTFRYILGISRSSDA